MKVVLACILSCSVLALASAQGGVLSEEELFMQLFGDELVSVTDPARMVTITKVKINVSSNIDEKWIESLLYVKVGMTLSSDEVDRLVADSVSRLTAMNHFYDVSAYSLIIGDQNDEAVVVVEVNDGFWYIFGFMPWNLTVGYSNLFNSGNTLMGTLGNNSQSVSFAAPHINYSAFAFNASFYHTDYFGENEAYLKDFYELRLAPYLNVSDYMKISVQVNLLHCNFPDSFFLFPNYASELSEQEKLERGVSSSKTYVSFGGGFEISTTRSFEKPLLSAGVRGIYLYHLSLTEPDRSYWSANGRIKTVFSPLKPLSFILRESAAYNSIDTYPYLSYSMEDFRGTTKGTSLNDFEVVSNLDLLLSQVATLSLGFTQLSFTPFVFGDLAYNFSENEVFEPGKIESGFGIGMHFYFSMPVNMYLTLGLSNSFIPEWTPGLVFNISNSLY